MMIEGEGAQSQSKHGCGGGELITVHPATKHAGLLINELGWYSIFLAFMQMQRIFTLTAEHRPDPTHLRVDRVQSLVQSSSAGETSLIGEFISI